MFACDNVAYMSRSVLYEPSELDSSNFCTASMQESTLLCLTRLTTVLPPTELSSQEIEDVRRVVHELGEASLSDKRISVLKRCEQFEGALADPDEVNKLIGKRQNISVRRSHAI